jgi:hypothetical protein
MRSDSVHEMIKKITENLKFPNLIVSFSHSDYISSLGGTEKVLHEEQMEYAKGGISYMQVYGARSRENGHQEKPLDQPIGVNVDSVPIGRYTLVQLALILEFLQRIKRIHLIALHLHHTMNLSVPGLLYLMNILHTTRVRVFLHDYFTICPEFNLLRNERYYCGVDCKDCDRRGERIPHFSRMKRLFADTKAEFIAPSQVAADVWQKSFPEHVEKIRVVPHQVSFDGQAPSQQPPGKTPNDRPRIAYLGYESICKGLQTWWELVSNKELTRRYDFFHLGAAGLKMPGVAYVPVSFLDDGPDAMIQALQKNRIDIAFLWSIWPETYSFTLFEAFAANCFVVTNEISGNIAVQVRASGRGAICHDEFEVFEMLKDVGGIKEMLRDHANRHSPMGLTFNPELIEESVGCMKPAAYFSYIENGGLEHLQEKSSDWHRFIRAIELEKIRADYIENMLHYIQELEKRLSETKRQPVEEDHSQVKRGPVRPPGHVEIPLHQMLDQLIEFLGRYPVLKRAGKAVFQAIWRVQQRKKLR